MFRWRDVGFVFDPEDLAAVSEYFHNLVKIVLVGDSGVGKTSLLRKVERGTFEDAYIPTIGADFAVKTITVLNTIPYNVKMQLWDTSGDDRFTDIVRSYTRGVSIILVFDVTNVLSFHRIRDYWMGLISLGGRPSRTTILIGNKCDVTDPSLRLVSTAQGIDMARELGISVYLDVSAKNGYQVDEAFASILVNELTQD